MKRKGGYRVVKRQREIKKEAFRTSLINWNIESCGTVGLFRRIAILARNMGDIESDSEAEGIPASMHGPPDRFIIRTLFLGNPYRGT